MAAAGCCVRQQAAGVREQLLVRGDAGALLFWVVFLYVGEGRGR